jgi:serine phosphatase RsbU (regulator of sigma subunit)
VSTATAGTPGQTDTGSAQRAKDFFDVYTKGLKASDLQLLFTRDTREAYEFFARGIDRTEIDKQPWYLRVLAYAKLFFVAFTMRLSPAHRALYAGALVVSLIGFAKLFSGFELLPVFRFKDVLIGLPLPLWQDSVIFLGIGFLLLNLLVVLEVADRLSLKHDLTVARDIQRAMLPQGTFRAPGIEVHGETRPANTVGGDFFDMIPLADGRVIVALGDVAGKGSPAALLMALTLAMLRTLVDEGLPPGPLLERLNLQLLRHAPRSRFVTIFFAVLELDGRMHWVNAGQNPPRIRRADGTIDELHATGVALGLFEGTTYTTSDQMLRPGDMLVAYSDGITEAENAAGQPFEEEGLDALLAAWASGSAPEVTQAVQRAVLAHVGDARVGDDLTVLVLRRV